MSKRRRKAKKKKAGKKLKKRRIVRRSSSSKNENLKSEPIFKVSKLWAKKSYVDKSAYEKKYKLSIKKNDEFWKKEGKRITWIKPYKKIKDVKYSKSNVKIKWYYDGTLNASANCIDRHLKKHGKKAAIIWVGDDPANSKTITYKELHKNVCKAANVLKSLGIQNLTFKKVEKKKFPMINLKKRIFEYPSSSIIINAANEILVDQFLQKKIPFLSISKIIMGILNDKNYRKYAIKIPKNINQILKIDSWARDKTKELIN